MSYSTAFADRLSICGAVTGPRGFFVSTMNIVPPSITDCLLQRQEISRDDVKMIINEVFQKESYAQWPAGGSPFQRWYRQNASLSTVVCDKKGRRLIAWKTGKPFLPENIFFRTVDTFRLLPMALAEFRVQIWVDPSVWERLDKKEDARVGWTTTVVTLMAHELALLRNMHDQGGADIPIIGVGWGEEIMDRALDYWVGLSSGKWSEEERQAKYNTASASCQRLLPTFAQANHLVCALYSDPAVGYVPPFVIFMPLSVSGRARVLFTKPSHMLHQAFAQSWPSCCVNPACVDSDCGMFDFTNSRCLAEGTAMVREGPWLPHRVVCNLWGCEEKHITYGGNVRMRRCERCKEVIYCDEMHQALDWGHHRKVCEKWRWVT